MAEPSSKPPVTVVGLHGGQWFGSQAEAALSNADILVGAQRMLDALPSHFPGKQIDLFGPLDQVIDLIETERAAGKKVCMLASGDPGFFGIERLLVGRFGMAVELHPAPSSVALAFARARVHWDDAAVVSCHGRSLERALPYIVEAPKVAVLVSRSNPPEAVGKALLAAESSHNRAVVCSQLGERQESNTETDIIGLAEGTFDPLSVVVLTSADPAGTQGGNQELNATVGWGWPVSEYRHRAGMITKPEVRAIALSKLELAPTGVLWDVGASSGSVGIEAAMLAPGLRVYAIEQNADDCERIKANSTRVALTVVEGSAPKVFADLPDPSRVFVGGGGLAVTKAALGRLKPGGRMVATFAVVKSALECVKILANGQLVQVSINRGVEIGQDGELRLESENPVFVVWGTKP